MNTYIDVKQTGQITEEWKISPNRSYILITPARNEEKHIATTINSIVNQTILPEMYVVVSDGSTDKTDDIVKSYETQYSFIKLLRFEKNKEANFSSKVFAFNAGLETIQKHVSNYNFIGNIDADISFDNDYFEKLLNIFDSEPNLGIAGGQIYEKHKGKLVRHRNSSYSVAGAVMMFRKDCYNAVGGYIPIEVGGEDSTAEITARARGWKVRTISELQVMHNKPCLSGGRNYLHSKFKQGLSNYLIGYHPLFQFAVCINRIIDKPYFAGAIAMFAGYIWGSIKRKKKLMPSDVIRFMRKEQLAKLLFFSK